MSKCWDKQSRCRFEVRIERKRERELCRKLYHLWLNLLQTCLTRHKTDSKVNQNIVKLKRHKCLNWNQIQGKLNDVLIRAILMELREL
jgi:hypothetical protein